LPSTFDGKTQHTDDKTQRNDGNARCRACYIRQHSDLLKAALRYRKHPHKHHTVEYAGQNYDS
jgi:hypothetical protein